MGDVPRNVVPKLLQGILQSAHICGCDLDSVGRRHNGMCACTFLDSGRPKDEGLVDPDALLDLHSGTVVPVVPTIEIIRVAGDCEEGVAFPIDRVYIMVGDCHWYGNNHNPAMDRHGVEMDALFRLFWLLHLYLCDDGTVRELSLSEVLQCILLLMNTAKAHAIRRQELRFWVVLCIY